MKYSVTLIAEYTCTVEAENEDDAFEAAIERAQSCNTMPDWSSGEPVIEEVSD